MSLPPSTAESSNEENHIFIYYWVMLTSSSGTPNLRRSCLAFFSESRRRSASVPVTVFFTGWGSLSSCSEKGTAYEFLHIIIFPKIIFRYFLLPIPHIYLARLLTYCFLSNPSLRTIPSAALVCLESSHKKILPHSQ